MESVKLNSLKRLALASLLVLGITGGCGIQNLDSLSQTLTPMSASVLGTATARANESGGGEKLETAVAVATQRAQEIYATQTVLAALNEPDRLATATAMAPIIAELPRYGVEIGDGYVGWLHNPVKIELQGYMTNGFVNDYPLVTAADFVLAADIKMDTVGSMAGCGFMFRSNGDADEPDQYSVLITRVAGGYMAFMATTGGNLSNFQYFFPKNVDKSFSWFNNETNRLAVVARGNILDLYTNGHLIATIDTTAPPPGLVPTLPQMELPPGATAEQRADYDNLYAQYDDTIGMINRQIVQAERNFAAGHPVYTNGLLGFVAFNQSGRMACRYENAWLFILNP